MDDRYMCYVAYLESDTVLPFINYPKGIASGYIGYGSTEEGAISMLREVRDNVNRPEVPDLLYDEWGSWHYGIKDKVVLGHITFDNTFIKVDKSVKELIEKSHGIQR